MPIDKIPLNQGINKDTEEVGLSTGCIAYLDCVVDDQGVLRRRPGLDFVCNVSHRPIDGLVYWPGQDVMIASSNAKLYTISRAGEVADVTGAGIPNVGHPLSFVEYSPTQVYLASGGRIISLAAGGTSAYIADGDAPTTVSHISAVNTYLLANKDGTEEVYWSDVGDPTTWNSEFITAEGKPDTLLAIHELNKLIYLFGSRTVQTLRDDGVTPFVFEYQGYVSRGAAGKDAVILCPYDNRFYFLDNTRMVVRLDGLQITPVSSSINRYLSNFYTVSDVRASYAQVAGRPYLFFNFPTEKKVIVFDVKNQDGFWSEWNKWDNISNEYSPFIGGATTCYVDPWGKSFVGDRTTGNIYRLGHDIYQDNGEKMRTEVITARINKGTESRRKYCHAVHFRLKKMRSAEYRYHQALATENGAGIMTEEEYQIAVEQTSLARLSTLLLKYRDDGREEWTAERGIPIVSAGGEYKATVRSLGSYFSRQWSIACSDDSHFEIATMEEEWS